MSRRVMAGAALVPALAAGGGVALAAPAGANGQGDPLYGDIDGDGWEDRAILSVDPATSRCAVSVQLGLPGGGEFGVPETYFYPAPGTGPWCPDMGVIVDLGGDGVTELVLAWFNGRPPGVDQDLLVLQNFVPVGGFTAIYQPSSIGTAHFDTDGLVDLWEYTDQGDGFQTWLNTPSGELVPGPMQVPFGGLGPYEFADFDENGATDIAFPYSERYDPAQPTLPGMGVAVALDDGTIVDLERADLSYGWGAIVTDVNHDGHTDVRSVNNDTGVVRTFLGNGAGVFTLAK